MKTLTNAGFTVYIGQNRIENDKLVRTSHRDDWWVHLHDAPSAHGVIKNPDNLRISQKILKFCCRAVAGQGQVYDATRIKNVKLTDTLGCARIDPEVIRIVRT
tara:strand:- start:307 stop:615 length:309 start_codon:yes stop_codon:yes gene_type:complete